MPLRLALVIFMIASTPHAPAETFTGRDTLDPAEEARADAAEVLETLRYPTTDFNITVSPVDGREHRAAVSFASPVPSGDASQDRVTLRWFTPADASSDAEPAPAVLLVHSLHPEMPVARMLARALTLHGVHAFVLELPGYGSRLDPLNPHPRPTGVTALLYGRQAIADTRRAADAIRALPAVDPARVSVQGTSLGSFVVAAAAAIDGTFAHTFLLLSGGDGADILTHGEKDAFHVKNALASFGYAGPTLIELLAPIEPLTLAHRLDPQRTWLINAVDDAVIPRANADRLAQAIGLPADHHLWLPGNHYTAFLLLPGVLDHMVRVIEPESP